MDLVQVLIAEIRLYLVQVLICFWLFIIIVEYYYQNVKEMGKIQEKYYIKGETYCTKWLIYLRWEKVFSTL